MLFLDGHGATVLTYSGLKVWDADGKTLPSRFETAATGLRLLVDERGARYPLTIDPIAQQAYLKAGNAGAGDGFGVCVSISDDTVVVGAPEKDGTGAAYVFVRSGVAWTQQAYLKASNAGGGDYFGYAVAVSGDTVVVGACQEASSTTGVNSTPNDNATYAGAAYVFVRSGTTWTQQAYLKASNTGAYDSFGEAVAVSGDTVVVGATYEDSSTTGVDSTPNNSGSNSGAAYIFVRSGTEWTQQAYLKASNTGGGDHFGVAVAVSDETVVVGASWEGSSTTGVNSTPNEGASLSGAAYVFTRSGTTWSQQAYLKASNTGAGDYFGYPVSITGDTMVVGAFGEDSGTTGVDSTPDENAANSGAAYVFVRSGTAWTQQAFLKASNAGAGDYFGMGVGISGDTVTVGAYAEDSSSTGVNSSPNESAANSGAAYVFTRSGTAWIQQAYLKAFNAGASDCFGTWVAVSGDTVVVGAHTEDSSSTGVNSTSNESAPNSGAAYVFTGLAPSTPPIVAAPTSTQVTTTTATLGGNVTSDGGAPITARGVVFAETATNNNPQLGGTGVSNVAGTGTTGDFTVAIGSLTPGTAYTFAAYATNSVGTGYSGTGSFTTLTAPAITTASPLPAGTVGASYAQTLAASGGTTPYSWSITSGALPSGLNWNNGTITGTPSVEGTANFTVRVTGGDGGTSTKDFSLAIQPPPVAPTIATASPLPAGRVGTAYGQQFSASGGVAPYAWTVASGQLPGGLSLSGAGNLSGTPTDEGGFSFTVRATGADTGTSTKVFNLNIDPAPVPPAITTASPLPEGMVGNGYSEICTASGGFAPYTWSLDSGSLPAGLSLAGDGTLSGTPTAAVTANFTVRVTGTDTGTATKSFALTIRPPSAELASLSLDGVTLAPVFAPGTTSYTGVSYAERTTVIASPSSLGAEVSVRFGGSPWLPAMPWIPADFLLTEGSDNLLEVKVTAADGITTRIYAVTITRYVPEIIVQNGEAALVDGSATAQWFGYSSTGHGVSQTFTITNAGTGNLQLGDFAVVGAHAADFTVGAPVLTSLPAGGSTTFSVADILSLNDAEPLSP